MDKWDRRPVLGILFMALPIASCSHHCESASCNRMWCWQVPRLNSDDGGGMAGKPARRATDHRLLVAVPLWCWLESSARPGTVRFRTGMFGAM